MSMISSSRAPRGALEPPGSAGPPDRTDDFRVSLPGSGPRDPLTPERRRNGLDGVATRQGQAREVCRHPSSSGAGWTPKANHPSSRPSCSASPCPRWVTATEARLSPSFSRGTGWASDLAGITLAAPGGSFVLDGDTDLPLRILLHPSTGEVRGILREVSLPDGTARSVKRTATVSTHS